MSRTTTLLVLGLAVLLGCATLATTTFFVGRRYFVIRGSETTYATPFVSATLLPTPTGTEAPALIATATTTSVPTDQASGPPPTATTAPAAFPATPTSIAVLNTDVKYVMAQTDVNIRSGPGTGFNVVGWVAEGMTAQVTGVSGDNGWWRVTCPDGAAGSCWITARTQYTRPSSGPVASPTSTPAGTACIDAATYVADVSVPDGTQLLPNTPFVKTWRLRNSGTCTWDSRYKLVHAGGHTLGASSTGFPLPATVAPGQTIDLSVDLIAPNIPDTYQADWKLQNPQAMIFGLGPKASGPFWVRIVVPPSQPSGNGSISGFAWQDRDRDNVVEPAEMLPAVTIRLAAGLNCEQTLASQKTDINGRFRFTGLKAGAYCLFGTDGTTTVSQSNLLLSDNQQMTEINVTWPPLWPSPSVISGLVYQDANGNRIYDQGETLMGNRQVGLFAGADCSQSSNIVAVTTSGGDGRYTLAGEFNGSYCLALLDEEGLIDRTQLTVSAGQTLNGVNLRTPAANGSISGWLWNDYCLTGSNQSSGGWLDGNCVPDGNGGYRADGQIQADEGFIAGVTILLQPGACANNTAIPVSAVTDASGRYAFNNLLPGRYCVSMNAAATDNAERLLPGDWTFPQPHIWYQEVTLRAGEQLTPVNFGWDYQLQ